MNDTPSGMTPGPGGRVIVARYGRDLEDFTVGDVYEHRPGRTATRFIATTPTAPGPSSDRRWSTRP